MAHQEVRPVPKARSNGAVEVAPASQDTEDLASRNKARLDDHSSSGSATVSQIFADFVPPDHAGQEAIGPRLSPNDNTATFALVSDAFDQIGGSPICPETACVKIEKAMAAAEDAERKKISSDLHDFVMQDVLGIRFDLKQLRQKCGEDAQVLLSEIEEMINNIDCCIRTISFANFSTFDPMMPLANNLRNLAIGFQKRSGINVTFSCSLEEVSQWGSEMLFRTAQEALVNIYRHSKATTANIRVLQKKGIISLEVRDNGQNDDPDMASEPALGVGLQAARERLIGRGGNLEIARSAQGFALIATIPDS